MHQAFLNIFHIKRAFRFQKRLKTEEAEEEDFISLNSNPQSNEMDAIETEPLLQKMGELNALVHSHPESIDNWKTFIKFQDDYFLKTRNLNENNHLERINRKSMIEKKISVYEKALKHHPENLDLLLGYLTEASKILE